MPRQPPPERIDACIGKVAFVTRRHADIARARRNGQRYPYRCRFCQHWHLSGHKATFKGRPRAAHEEISE